MWDFGALPPEINSGLMYAGAGSSALIAAANAWASLAQELDAAASGCAAVLSKLTSDAWKGPAAAEMASAAAPYVAWLHASSDRAARAASSAAAAANAYQTAYAATVPPAVIAANRAQLAALVATNVLGQNTPAIAATEAHYSHMWARDATAMYSYAGHCAAAAALDPLTAPPATTTPVGPGAQTAATAHAAAAAASQTTLSQLITTLPTTLHTLATPSALSSALNSLNVIDPANASSASGLSGLLNMLSGRTGSSLGAFLNSETLSSAFSGGFFNPEGFLSAFHAFDWIAIYAATDYVHSVMGAGAGGGVGGVGGGAISQMGSVTAAPPSQGVLGVLAAAHTGDAAATAGVGKATMVGGLSAPPAWTSTAAPAVRLVSAESPLSAATPLASPILTTGMPRLSTARMVGKTPGNRHSTPANGTPAYGIPTDDGIPSRSLSAHTPAGG
ncbi:PPE family protein [Mycobacterium botniense]|uniref:PPE family protein n=1 Tax=Mycobacterium botniense TaxID=84962 RepID=A0A7I9XVJ4_9MYCO|nr:PPE family protein [Mycobacterium botniense]